MAVPDGYHFTLTIGGVTYPFVLPDIRGYVWQDLSAFTQRTSSGGLSLADLDQQGGFEQRTFASGMGQIEMVEANRYRYAAGLDPRTLGAVTLWTQTNTAAVTPTTPVSMAIHSIGGTEYLVMAGTGGVFVWDGTTVTNISTGLPHTSVLEVFSNGATLFAGLDDSGGTNYNIYRFSGTVAAPAWSNVSSTASTAGGPRKARAFAIHEGYHWHAEKGTNLIHYWSQEDGADATGMMSADSTHAAYSATGDPGAVEVGPRNGEVKRLVSYDGQLFAFRTDGIWTVRLEGNISNENAGEYVAYKLFDFRHENSTYNFDSVVVWNGALWFNVNKKFYRFTGTTIQDFTPPGFTMNHPPTRHTRTLAILPFGAHLYAIQDDNLYVTDGTGWHLLKNALTGYSTPRATLAYYLNAPTYPRLCALVTNGTNTTLLHWRCDDEYARGPYESGTGSLYTSRFDAGFMNVPKHWGELKVLTHIPAAGGSITVSAYNFAGDSATKYPLGTITAADGDATITVDGAETVWNRVLSSLSFPDTATGYSLELRFDFERDSGSGESTPILYGYLLEYVLRPPTIYGFRPLVHLADNMLAADGTRTARTAKTNLALLKTARDSVTPLDYEDFLGNSGKVYISALSIRAEHWNPAGHAEGTELVVQLNLIMIERGCEEVTISAGETLTVEGTYVVLCALTIEATGTLTVNT